MYHVKGDCLNKQQPPCLHHELICQECYNKIHTCSDNEVKYVITL